MALVPHKITALAESDEQGTDGKNIVAGAIVVLYDTSGEAAVLYDDENGANGSTVKQTDAKGQIVVYVTPGEYDEQVNGSVRRRVAIGGNGVISYGTTAELQASRPNKTGQRAENRERANAQYTLAAEGYTALAGDVVAANGRVWVLQTNGAVFVTNFETIQDAEDRCQVDGFELLFPSQEFSVTSTLQKSNYTVWRGVGSNAASGGLGTVINSAHNGITVNVTGVGRNQRGYIESIRFLNDKDLYPDAVAINMESSCQDHKVKDCYIGNYYDGIVLDGSPAIYLETVYTFGITNDGCRVQNGATDCWFINSQFQGGNIGLNLDGSIGSTIGSMQVLNSRPQVSGVWNMRAKKVSFLNVRGGFNDTAVIFEPQGGGGLLIEDCANFSVDGTVFYANGENKPHIQISCTAGGVCTDGIITGVQAKKTGANQGASDGILFKDIAGTCRRIVIDNCNLEVNDNSIKFENVTGVLDTLTLGSGNFLNNIVGEDLVANELRHDGGAGIVEYLSVSSPLSNVDISPITPKLVRVSGTVASDIDINLPATGNYAGKSLKIIRIAGGVGVVNIKDSSGAIRHVLNGPNQWVEVASIGLSTWVEAASDDLSR